LTEFARLIITVKIAAESPVNEHKKRKENKLLKSGTKKN